MPALGERETDKERQRQKDRKTDRQRQRQIETGRDRQRDRHREWNRETARERPTALGAATLGFGTGGDASVGGSEEGSY